MLSPADSGLPESSSVLTDPNGRKLDYLRFAVTDRCNLRCRYCMPEEGVAGVSHDEIITFAEAERLCAIFCQLGVRKIRITGGEPLVRRGVVPFMGRLAQGLTRPEVLLTTNGLLLEEKLDQLQHAGIKRVNLSLDSLDPETWSRITRRGGLDKVLAAIDAVLLRGMGLKINVVVLRGINDHELEDFVALTRARDLAVRFIESMSFDGQNQGPAHHLPGREILARLRSSFDLVPQANAREAVGRMFRIAGYSGSVGVIEGHARNFCDACNRLRLDARGRLRTCLYGQPQVDLLAMVRQGCRDDELAGTIVKAVNQRSANGHAAQHQSQVISLISMANIGG